MAVVGVAVLAGLAPATAFGTGVGVWRGGRLPRVPSVCAATGAGARLGLGGTPVEQVRGPPRAPRRVVVDALAGPVGRRPRFAGLPAARQQARGSPPGRAVDLGAVRPRAAVRQVPVAPAGLGVRRHVVGLCRPPAGRRVGLDVVVPDTGRGPPAAPDPSRKAARTLDAVAPLGRPPAGRRVGLDVVGTDAELDRSPAAPGPSREVVRTLDAVAPLGRPPAGRRVGLDVVVPDAGPGGPPAACGPSREAVRTLDAVVRRGRPPPAPGSIRELVGSLRAVQQLRGPPAELGVVGIGAAPGRPLAARDPSREFGST